MLGLILTCPFLNLSNSSKFLLINSCVFYSNQMPYLLPESIEVAFHSILKNLPVQVLNLLYFSFFFSFNNLPETALFCILVGCPFCVLLKKIYNNEKYQFMTTINLNLLQITSYDSNNTWDMILNSNLSC